MCSTPGICQIALNTNIHLADCDDQLANYISAEYSLIPSKINILLSLFFFLKKSILKPLAIKIFQFAMKII